MTATPRGVANDSYGLLSVGVFFVPGRDSPPHTVLQGRG